MGVTNLRVGKEDLSCLNYHHQEMKEKMEEVSLQKGFQNHAGNYLAARARRQGRALSKRHQARAVEKKGVIGNNSAHS